MSLCLIGCHKPGIINNPDFESYNYNDIYFGIDKIELTDSATVFDISLYNEPGFWVSVSPSIKLKGRNTGKDYTLKFMEGLAPDIMVHVDSTGFYSARLFFEPIEKADSLIDLMENEELMYKGIKLYDDSEGKIVTRLTGSVNGLGISWLIVREADPNNKSKTYIVPVRNGKFDYEFYTEEPLICNVFLGKEWHEGYISKVPCFWSEGGNIQLDFKDGLKDFTIHGGLLTQELIDFKERGKAFYENNIRNIPELKRYYDLRENEKLYVPEYYSLKQQHNNAVEGWIRIATQKAIIRLQNSDSLYTPEGEKALLEMDKFYESHRDSLNKLVEDNLDREYLTPTLSKLFHLYEDVLYNHNLDENIHRFLTNFADTFTNSPYHKYIRELSDLGAPVIGNHFVNIILPDKNGQERSLSDIIDGKPALLIFQNEEGALAQVNSLAAIYEDYHSKGMEVVSIMPESAGKKKGKYEKSYSWTVLYDKNDKTGAWRKYRLGNQKLKTFLINEMGIIVAIDPDIKQIESLLISKK